MDRYGTDPIDLQLGAWLRDESATRAPTDLVEGVFARTSRTRQARRWWPAVGLRRSREAGPRVVVDRPSPPWLRASALGAVGVAVVLLGLAVAVRPTGPAPALPGASGGSPVSSPVVTPSPTIGPTPTAALSPTPEATVLGTRPALRLDLGANAGPVDVIAAFGSIWVADLHAWDVRRFDPATMRELARISVQGAAWFAVADDALWVSGQRGTGVSRIDPETNTVVAHLGDAPTCAAPVVAFGSLWQSACDANVILRIDPVGNVIQDTIPSGRHRFLVEASGQLIALGPDGLARLDPQTFAFTELSNPDALGAEFLTSDGTSVWVQTSGRVHRIDPSTGTTTASVALEGPQAMAFAEDRVWLTSGRRGILELDPATLAIRRTIPVLPAPLVPAESDGVLWVTSLDDNALWRVEP